MHGRHDDRIIAFIERVERIAFRATLLALFLKHIWKILVGA